MYRRVERALLAQAPSASFPGDKSMPSATLNLEMPADEVDSLQNFAVAHGLTVAELVSRFAKGLKTVRPASIHPEVLALTGLVPANWDVEADHRRHLLDKHR
jgi:hypothetical protein